MADRAKKILIFSTSYFPFIGGAEVAIKEITARLPSYQFYLITSRTGNLPRSEKIGAVRVYRIGPKMLLPVFGLLKAIVLRNQEGDFDAIFASQASYGGGAAWLHRIFFSAPLVVNFQEGKDFARLSRLTNFFRRLILKKADHVTAISTFLAHEAEKLGAPLSKISVIPNGVSVKDFSRPLTDVGDAVRREFALTQDEKVIVSTSRLVPKNGMDILIRSAPILGDILPATKWKMLIIGDGPDQQELQNLISTHNLQNRVLLLGARPHEALAGYLAVADVFVRPSRSEGLGVSFFEAMAAGVPIIAPLIGGIPDFLEGCVTGLACRPEDPQSVAEKIAFVFQNKTVVGDITIRAKALVAEKFSWDSIAQEYKVLFDQL